MLYDLTVPAYQNGLKALSGELSKARARGADNGIGQLQFAVARLAPDMAPLASYVRFPCIQALPPLHRLGGLHVPHFPQHATNLTATTEHTTAPLPTPTAPPSHAPGP